MIKIIITDDHSLIRAGFKKLIEREFDIKLLAEANNAKELFKFLKKEETDIVILDISLPDKNGLDVVKEIKRLYPKQKILILSMHPEERYALRALKGGASGYINKNTAVEELINAIRKVYNGGIYVSKNFADQLVSALTIDADKLPHKGLSDREFQILLMLGKGKSVGEISNILSLSINTVNTYRRRILQKMNMKTNAELIRYAIESKLVD